MFNKKSTNTPLILRNCASKNSLKPLFKVDVQAKISLNKGTLFINHLGPICLLYDAKIHSSKGVFVLAIGFFDYFYNFEIFQ